MNAIPSRYNYLLTVGGTNYVFSAATGKLAVVEGDSVWQFLKGCGCEGVSDSVIAGLLRDGFAVLPGADEVVAIGVPSFRAARRSTADNCRYADKRMRHRVRWMRTPISGERWQQHELGSYRCFGGLCKRGQARHPH